MASELLDAHILFYYIVQSIQIITIIDKGGLRYVSTI
jgi:hypothetical protein